MHPPRAPSRRPRKRGRRPRWRQRAAGQRLRQAEDVGHGLGRRGEQGAGAAEAGHDLVGDHQYAVGIAGGADRGERRRVVEAHAARALHARLDDDGGDVRICQQRVERGACFGLSWQLGEDLRHAVAGQRGVEAAAGIGDRKRAERVAVVAVPEGDEAAAVLPAVLPVLHGHLERDLDGHRPGFGKEHALQIARQQGGEPPCERQRRFMHKAREHHMRQGVELRRHGLHDVRVTVAVAHRPPRGNAVDQLAAVGEPDAHPGSRDDRQRRRRGGHLRVRQPEGVDAGHEKMRGWTRPILLPPPAPTLGKPG